MNLSVINARSLRSADADNVNRRNCIDLQSVTPSIITAAHRTSIQQRYIIYNQYRNCIAQINGDCNTHYNWPNESEK